MCDEPHPPAAADVLRAEIEYHQELCRHYKALYEAERRKLEALRAAVEREHGGKIQ